MNWTQNIAHWRSLTPEAKLRRRWETIPADVAQSMAFEGGTGAAGDHPRDTRSDRATRFVETTRGILTCAQLAPLLAERGTAAETEIYREVFHVPTLRSSRREEAHSISS